MPNIIQPSFARGEIAPDLYGRVDVPAYSVSLRTALNAVVHAYGGVSNRPGLKFIGPCMSHSGVAPRLIEFKFNTQDTYILEFGDQKMRVIRNDAHVLETAANISDVTQADPAVVTTATAHGYSNGDDVYIVSVAGMTQLNGRWFKVANAATSSFELTDQRTSAGIDSTGYSAYVSGGTVSKMYEIATPYTSADLDELKHVQSANVMTLVHRSYAPRELSRTGHSSWTLATIAFEPEQNPPSSISVVVSGSAGSETYEYRATAIRETDLEESLPVSGSVSGAADPPDNTITVGTVSGALKYAFYRRENGIYGFLGESETGTFHDDNYAADTTLTPPKARNPFAAAGDYPGTVSYYQQRRVFASTNNKPDTTYYSVTASGSNMSQSSPRRADDAITATLNSREVNQIRALVPLNDLLVLTSGAEWRVSNGGEAAFSLETLRQKPQSSWGSSFLDPIVLGGKVLFVTENNSYIRSIGYDITVDGYKGDDITVFAPHLFRDYVAVDWAMSASPDPLIAVVRSDGKVAALTFNPEQEVVAWARWETDGKFKRVSATRPNGDAVDTAHYFVVEREIGGTKGYYIERVASRRFEDVRDAFFVDSGLSLDNPVVITGVTQANPVVITAAAHGFSNGDEVDIHDIEWASDVDASFNETQPDQLNGRRYQVASAATNTFELVKTSGRVDITGATQANPVVITAAAHGFSNGDVIGVFNVGGMTALNGNTYKVVNSTSDTFELNTLGGASVDGTGYSAYTSGGQCYPAEDGSAFNAYREGGAARLVVSGVGGVWHLEGEEVVILADGNVISGKTVQNGVVSFDRGYSRVHLGLRYVTDIQTLNPESGRGTVQGKKVRVPKATVRFLNSRGLLIGPNQFKLTEVKQRTFEKLGEPTNLLTGDKETVLTSDWRGGGRVFMRQVHPLPLTVLAVIPHLDEGDSDE